MPRVNGIYVPPQIFLDAHVAETAASRVRRSAWEEEEDRKDREVDEFLRRMREVIKAADLPLAPSAGDAPTPSD